MTYAGEEKVVMGSEGVRWRGIFAGVSVLQIATMICGLVLMPVACVLSFLVFVIFMAMPGANEGSMTARFEAEMRGVTFAIAIGPVLAAAVLPVLVYVRRGRSPVRNWVALVVGSILGVGLAGLVMGVYWIWPAL